MTHASCHAIGSIYTLYAIYAHHAPYTHHMPYTGIAPLNKFYTPTSKNQLTEVDSFTAPKSKLSIAKGAQVKKKHVIDISKETCQNSIKRKYCPMKSTAKHSACVGWRLPCARSLLPCIRSLLPCTRSHSACAGWRLQVYTTILPERVHSP